MPRASGFAPLFVALTTLTLAPGCTKRPVLYPNEHLKQVGHDAAQADVDQCLALAEQEGVDSSSAATETAGRTAAGGAVGAASGAVGGAIYGNAGRGAATGAAAGATAGLLWGLFSRREPEPVHRTFVERCLKERGYDPVGWQ